MSTPKSKKKSGEVVVRPLSFSGTSPGMLNIMGLISSPSISSGTGTPDGTGNGGGAAGFPLPSPQLTPPYQPRLMELFSEIEREVCLFPFLLLLLLLLLPRYL